MIKGEKRKERKARAANGQPWNVELDENGQQEIVRERTSAQERRHGAAMERWAKQYMDSDPDWR